MNILLICPYFPPEGEIAAIRIGKFAEYWCLAGHKVTVITRNPVTTGTKVPHHENLTVLYANDPLGVYHSTYKNAQSNFFFGGAASKLLGQIKKFALIPDQFWMWSRNVFTLFFKEKLSIDLVVASGAPISALHVGAKISQKIKVPFVADYRDLISSVSNYPLGKFRQKIDSRIEKNAVRNASLITAASSGCVENLRSWFSTNFQVIENGFEPSDYQGYSYEPFGSEFNVVYTGSVYCEESDLTPFFQAVSQIKANTPEIVVKLHYYGRVRSLNCILDWAKKYDLENVVVNHGMVTHQQVTQAQIGADLLLLLMVRDSPENQWVLSGKYYEYLGAGRPILQIGLESGELAQRIRKSSKGFVSSDANAIEQYLVKAYSNKVQNQESQYSLEIGSTEYTREFQSLKMLSHFHEIVK